MKRSLIALWLGLVAAGAALAAPARTTPGVLPPNATAYGKTYAEWSVAWYQWLMSVPTSKSPVFDPSETPANVLYMQTGHVLFPPVVRGNANTIRRATLPSGHPLLFTILSGNADNYATDPPWSLKDLQDGMTWAFNHATVYASVDGVPVRDLDSYRCAATGSYYIPETDNPWQALGYQDDPGWYEFATEGWWITLAPPSIGRHIIKTGWHMQYPELDPPEEYQQDVTFIIDIVPAGQYKQ